MKKGNTINAVGILFLKKMKKKLNYITLNVNKCSY